MIERLPVQANLVPEVMPESGILMKRWPAKHFIVESTFKMAPPAQTITPK